MTTIRIVLFLALFLVVAAPAGAATHRVPGDFATIQEAVDAAQAGDTIRIRSGNHDGFHVQNRLSLRIIGSGDHLILGEVQVTNSELIELRGLEVVDNIIVKDSVEVGVRRCRVFDAKVEIDDSPSGFNNFIERCRVEGGDIGIVVAGNGYKVTRNIVANSVNVGIQAQGDGEVFGNKIEGGASVVGISVSGEDGAVLVKRNQIVDVAGAGITIAGLAHRIERNEVLGTQSNKENDGIQCAAGGAHNIVRNLVKRTHDGIDLKGDCSGNQLVKNKIRDVRSDGMDVETDSNRITDNRIIGVAANGIELEGSGNTVTGNKIKDVGSGHKEIAVVEENNTVSDNKCRDNKDCGGNPD